MKKNVPILITGAHRSGSTWVGRVIESSGKVLYIHEPFNIQNVRYKIPFKYWFQYVGSDSAVLIQSSVRSYVDKFLQTSKEQFWMDFTKIRSLKMAFRLFQKEIYKNTKTPLLKDPLALFSAPWLYESFDCNVVVTIRHPAAFAASLKIKNWTFNFNHFLEQENLMNGVLAPYKSIIKEYATTEKPIILQAALLWNCLYHTVLDYQIKYKNDWYFVTHENLSKDPKNEFSKLFSYLGLNVTDKVHEKIKLTADTSIATEHSRNALKNIKTWKDRLTSEEISIIKTETKDVWTKFYDENNW